MKPQTILCNNQIVKITNTWFSINARVQAFGKTVTGYVTGRETDTEERDYEFIPYLYRKNHTVLTSRAQ